MQYQLHQRHHAQLCGHFKHTSLSLALTLQTLIHSEGGKINMTSYLLIPRCPGPPLDAPLRPKTRPACLRRTAEEPKVPQGPGQQLGSHRAEEEAGGGRAPPPPPSGPPHPMPRRHTLFLFSFGASVTGASPNSRTWSC